MGLSSWEYRGYRDTWLIKRDLHPSVLSHFGIAASQKDIDAVMDKCCDGWITIGGYGYRKHIRIYSIEKLRRFLGVSL